MKKKYDVLYDWPLSKIEHLCNSDTADAFAATLQPDGDLDAFTALTEQIRTCGAAMKTAKDGRAMFSEWSDLRVAIEKLGQQYPTFPDSETARFGLWLILAEKLRLSLPVADASGAVLDEEDVDEDLFELRALGEEWDVEWFVYENVPSFSNSLVVVDCSDLAVIASELAGTNVSPKMLFHFLAALQSVTTVPVAHLALVCRQPSSIPDAAVTAFAKLVVLISGRPVHRPYEYPAAPSVLDRASIVAGHKYQQFGDILDVLSEYNSRKELLAKYLTLYHVVENFMFRLPIVRLERGQAGQMFSIRDFARLYESVDQNELGALRMLCDEVFPTAARGGLSFSDHIKKRWKDLAHASRADLDSALVRIGMARKDGRLLRSDDFTREPFSSSVAKLVYAVRNAVVHNKETEFHLTHATLDAPLRILLGRFLIPSLEEMCFSLIGSPNPQLWYSRRELVLYKE